MNWYIDPLEQQKEDARKLHWVNQRLDTVTAPKNRRSSFSKSTSINSFRAAPNPQTSSSLLQLPIELRLKILRLLLVNDGPITTYKKYYDDHNTPGHAAKKSEWLSPSSQVLRCCQLLYRTGSDILYQENIITIQVFRWGFRRAKHTYYLAVLDEYTGFPEWPLPISRGQVASIPDDWAPSFWIESTLPGIESLNIMSSRTYQTLLRFHSVLLLIPHDVEFPIVMDNLSELSLACLLREYVAGKHITVSIHPEDIGTPAWSRQLKGFEFWRCESITFLNWCQDDSIMTDQQTRYTQQMVMDATQLEESIDAMIEVYNLLIQLNDYFRGCGFRDCFGLYQEWNEVEDAVIECDEQKFRERTKALLVRILVGQDADEVVVIEKLMERL